MAAIGTDLAFELRQILHAADLDQSSCGFLTARERAYRPFTGV
jgi:hypothetical protein